MATIEKSLYPGGGFGRGLRFMIDATCVAGAFAVRSTSTSSAGEVVDASTTGAADLIGLYDESVTYSATQSAFDGYPADEEGTVLIECDPFAVYKLRAAGSATEGAALAAAAPANVLVNESADTTGLIITDDVVGTVSRAGGIVVGKTGNNAGIVRRVITHNNNTDIRTEVPFPRTIAVGDSFIVVPWSKAGQTVQLTTSLREADASIVVATGAPFVPTDLAFDIINSEVLLKMVARDAWLNPLS